VLQTFRLIDTGWADTHGLQVFFWITRNNENTSTTTKNTTFRFQLFQNLFFLLCAECLPAVACLLIIGNLKPILLGSG
jgi:hypothetical protein